MKICEKCEQQNGEEALFCLKCGAAFPAATDTAVSAEPLQEEQQWRTFIGPNADRYLQQFRKFTAGPTPRFALTWHWPAFLFDPFLWFLYRKLYLYALVYAIGPVLSAYLTGDMTVGIVWRVMAGFSANYVYYWHVKDQLATIHKTARFDPALQARALKEAGGVQPYVIWVGVALHALLLAMIINMIREGPPEGGPLKRPLAPLSPARTLSGMPSR
jgi:hypothetical protein